MKIALNQIADIQLGYSFRSKVERSSNSLYRLIQMKDLGDDNKVNCADLMPIDMNHINERHLARKDDLLFRSRGLDFSAAILTDEVEDVLFSAPLIRIRILNNTKVIPEYLNWYIRQPAVQGYFQTRMTGTVQKLINKSDLEELEVLIPSISEQQLIAEIAQLADREMILLKKISEKKSVLISQKLNQFIINTHGKND